VPSVHLRSYILLADHGSVPSMFCLLSCSFPPITPHPRQALLLPSQESFPHVPCHLSKIPSPVRYYHGSRTNRYNSYLSVHQREWTSFCLSFIFHRLILLRPRHIAVPQNPVWSASLQPVPTSPPPSSAFRTPAYQTKQPHGY